MGVRYCLEGAGKKARVLRYRAHGMRRLGRVGEGLWYFKGNY